MALTKRAARHSGVSGRIAYFKFQILNLKLKTIAKNLPSGRFLLDKVFLSDRMYRPIQRQR